MDVTRSTRRWAALACGAGALLVAAPSALGATQTIGQLASPTPGGDPPPVTCYASAHGGDILDPLAGGSAGDPAPSYQVPAGGTEITSWSTYAAAGDGQSLALKIFRPTTGPLPGYGYYKVVGHDAQRGLTPGVVNTFPVSIPVQKGDLLGFNVPGPTVGTACAFYSLGDPVYGNGVSTADGDVNVFDITYNQDNNSRLNLTAVVNVKAFGIEAVAPTSGSVTGGTKVTITGGPFDGATAVHFGTLTATSFTVDSPTQISAVSPAQAAGTVDVRVSTPTGGTTPIGPTDQFRYVNTTVPGTTDTTTGTTTPSNHFTLAGTKLKKTKITLSLHLPGPGRVTVLATARIKGRKITFGRKSLTVRGGSATVGLTPGRTARSALKRVRAASIKLRITFTPTGGKAASTTKTVTVTGGRH